MLSSKHALLEMHMEELTDILVGLEQRISAYKNRFQELEKKRRRLDDEIATIKKYLELPRTGRNALSSRSGQSQASQSLQPTDYR